MIRLHSDYLVFELDTGEAIPCSVEAIAFELVEAIAGMTDRNIIENAARAVVHYFREELKQEAVSIKEFIECLSFVLKGFGFEIETKNLPSNEPTLDDLEDQLNANDPDSTKIYTNSLVDILDNQRKQGSVMEMGFFQELRSTINDDLSHHPDFIQFTGLRPCVQSLLSTNRWTKKCESLSKQLVQYLEECAFKDGGGQNLTMVIK